MKRFDVSDSDERLTAAGAAGASLVPAGSVLFVVRGMSLAKEFRVAVTGREVAFNQDLRGLVPCADVNGRYLARFLQAQGSQILGLVDEASHGTKRLISERFENVAVPVVSLAEQRRIAAILDKADALRVKRRVALGHLEVLTQTIFLDMFGDPITNPKRWTTFGLGEVTEFFGGSTLPAGSPFVGQQKGYFLLKVSDMNREGNDVMLQSAAYWSGAPGAAACTCPAGSVVIPKRGGAIQTNKKRITVRDSVLDPNLMGIWPRPEVIELSFLYAWFLRLDLTSITSGSSVPQLNKQDLARLRIAVPTIDAQKEFSRRLTAIGTLGHAQRKALARSDALFASLQRRAFRGRL